MITEDTILIVGELIVDFTLPFKDSSCKLRLGGIAHAARGLWACDKSYAVAAVCPKYLVNNAKQYLEAHGCIEFIWLGEVDGSPNVMVINDPTEVADQGYEDLLREEKSVVFFEVSEQLHPYKDILIFPGNYRLNEIHSQFSPNARFSFDAAYDIENFSDLNLYTDSIRSLIISTSSPLFKEIGATKIDDLIEEVKKLGAEVFLLKENRGGSRLFVLNEEHIEHIPATLGQTVNSVGVGDVYSACMVCYASKGWIEAAWRGAGVATEYSQTTYPDDFKVNVQRNLKIPLDTLKSLSGTCLNWHERPNFPIYLAAPDFSYVDRQELDNLINSLEYHNFCLRRPIQENGELELNSGHNELLQTYIEDVQLINECVLILAVPLGRDPGTLVEVGIAISQEKPVITYDPRQENNNTMVRMGSSVYSDDLDTCLNGLFEALSKLKKA